MSWRRQRWMREVGRTALTGMLCGLVAVPQAAFGATGAASKATVLQRPAKLAPLTQQERVLHALNRFTFGPRPGEVEAVEKMGLQNWFIQQLQPEKIDDSAFEQRMNQFPAMRLTQAELTQRFPSQATVRMAERRDVQVPIARDPASKAIFADAKFDYQERQKAKALDVTQAQPAQMQPAIANGEMAPAAEDLNKKGKARAKDLAGPVPADEVQAVLALAPEQRVERLVEMRPAEMFAFKSALKPMQKLLLVEGMTPTDQEIAESFVTTPERVVSAEVLEERLERDVFSERQLQAVMTDFWLNHFSVYLRKNQNEPYYLPAYERNVILPNALGKFENLLVAVAQSPAMLMYLDNWESVGPHSPQAEKAERAQMFRPANKQRPAGINENYGRELMELHTLGVNGGYTQQDVIEVSKCFTGWTIDKPYGGGFGRAIFDENKHEPGTKTVLGHKIKENGQKEGLEVLHILATSPATAHFVSEKLAVRFVSDDPPPALVNRMAATFLKSDGNIRAVMLTMFRSPEFWSPQVYRAKVKTPIEFMASALRASGADVKTPLALVQAMDRLGMPIYGMLTPQGYSWKSEDWVSSNALISRMNFALVLSGNRVPGVRTDWPELLGASGGGDSASAVTPDVETENKLEVALLGAPASDRTRSTVLEMAGDPTAQQSAEEAFRAKPVEGDAAMVPAAGLMRAKAARGPQPGLPSGPVAPLDTMAGLLLGSPEFQRR